MKTPMILRRALKACADRIGIWADLPPGVGDGFAYNREGTRCRVSEKAVLQQAAAWACVTLLADVIGSLPANVYRRKRSGERELATDHPLSFMLKVQPNSGMSPSDWFGAMAANLLLSGYSYSEKIMNGDTWIGSYPLQSSATWRTRTASGSWEYRTIGPDGKQRTIPESRIMRIPAFTLDGVCALSPISYGALVFGGASDATTAAQKAFQNGLLSTVAFSTEQVLKADQREEYRGNYADKIAGVMNAGKPPFLEAGIRPWPLSMNPVDAQLLESRAFSVEEICSWFRVPPFMIGRASEGQTNWGTGIEQQMIGFITFTLRPWLNRIEQAMERQLPPAERGKFYVEFNVEGLLRGDSAARAALYASGLQNGWINRDEVRAKENLNSIPGGEVYTVQSNLLPIEQLGKQQRLSAVEAVQKAYLGVGRMLTADEARALVNEFGADLKIPGPDFPATPPNSFGNGGGQ